MKAPETKIALILYTLREHCTTYEDLDKTLETLKDIGYQAVQVSGVAVDPHGVKELLEKHNMYACGIHVSRGECLENLQGIKNNLKLWNCDFAALGHPGGNPFNSEGLDELVPQLTDIGLKLKEDGYKFGYHNHHGEFVRINGKLWLEELYKRTPSDALYAELDLHWITRGGASPVAWIKKVAGRMQVVHFKDFVMFEGQPAFCEVGEGNLDWSSILTACAETGVRWYVVEQDSPFNGRDIFESVAISYKNLRNMGVK